MPKKGSNDTLLDNLYSLFSFITAILPITSNIWKRLGREALLKCTFSSPERSVQRGTGGSGEKSARCNPPIFFRLPFLCCSSVSQHTGQILARNVDISWQHIRECTCWVWIKSHLGMPQRTLNPVVVDKKSKDFQLRWPDSPQFFVLFDPTEYVLNTKCLPINVVNLNTL